MKQGAAIIAMSKASKTIQVVAIATSFFLIATSCTRHKELDSSAPIVALLESAALTKAEIAPAVSLSQAKISRLKKARLARVPAEHRKSALAAFSSETSPVIASTVVFEKAAILNRVFLYGSDLQYSSVGEEDGMMLQSMAVGHAHARFQVLGDRLQLVAEEKYRFQSNINIPLRLLHEWPIVADSASQLTVKISSGSPVLAGLFGSENPARTSWVRSVEFIPNGNYLLIESSLELADGKVAEFMESLFPRETLIANTPSPIYDDESLEPMASRFGFLSDNVWLTLPTGRTKTAVANRFAPPAIGQTIDWYVTSNLPEEYLPAVRDGVEGWNRYSKKMWGRDFIKFKGHLPKGIKIGDPRYNVINWDSVVDASSAYESQAADPETGIQSHSLIYLPYAWIKIGEEFWANGEVTQDRTAVLKAALDKIHFLGEKVNVRCFNEGENAINALMMQDPETFAKELLKGVLFHEVGHALGLAHNFKGSLEWDPDVPGTLFTSSVMEYSQYQIEGGAFDAVSTETVSGAGGPLLEYDRQILSVLYNTAKDVAPTDRVVPHCDDAAADSTAGGVDPFCLRYDAGKDPSVILEKTLKLIQDPTSRLGKTKSLAQAIENLQAGFPDPAEVTTIEELRDVEMEYRTKTMAVTQFYLSAGAQGLNYMLNQNLRALSIFRAGADPVGADPAAVRSRVVSTMDFIMDMESFSPATRKAIEKLGDHALQWVRKTAWYTNAAQNLRTEREEAMRLTALKTVTALEIGLLPRIRARQIGTLKASTTAPFFLSAEADFEKKAVDWIGKALVGTLPSGASYGLSERLAAAQSLTTFVLTPEAYKIRDAARTKILAETASATTAQERQALRAILQALN